MQSKPSARASIGDLGNSIFPLMRLNPYPFEVTFSHVGRVARGMADSLARQGVERNVSLAAFIL